MEPICRLIPPDRLHLHHGPIDLIIGADGDRDAAFDAAKHRFQTVLAELVDELPDLRLPLHPGLPEPQGETARRMHHATRPFTDVFVTRMAAVAGAVADTVLTAMAPHSLTRAYVNNGGDIALRLAEGQTFDVAIAHVDGSGLGHIRLTAGTEIGGIATSGHQGRSLSMGIADTVTVLASNAACADVAATLIANAVDLPGHPQIRRAPANTCREDSDLGNRPVVVDVGHLPPEDVQTALAAGAACAQRMRAGGLIHGAALFLQGDTKLIGQVAVTSAPEPRIPEHA